MEKKILEILVEIQSDMRNLKLDVGELKADVAELKTDVAQLKADMVEVKSELAEQKKELKKLSEREERHYYMLQNSIEDVVTSVRYLDRKKMDRDEEKKAI